jgi:hypothetical protein
MLLSMTEINSSVLASPLSGIPRCPVLQGPRRYEGFAWYERGDAVKSFLAI